MSAVEASTRCRKTSRISLCDLLRWLLTADGPQNVRQDDNILLSMWNIFLAACVLGLAVIYFTIGGPGAWLMRRHWLPRYGEVRVKQALIVGMCFVGIGAIGLTTIAIQGCMIHPSGCLAG